ncbi:lymphocyte cytosolic protein 2a isoform X2 [Phyllopteryx taeniolatus]|uniref:lymphocyte cytosolic protein 2a isoform X2 n=1 Tax=Phyllopteryx taeniolatus TaxID=161469 RepID=UPI002AD2D9C3|nr:lymphocyte cytosolic protein 2a isoform X2 [Phyllopteryx taeniolatus]
MSGGRVPSRSEVVEWSPQQLADHLRKMNLTDCDRTVLKNSINGKRFVNLSDNDLQKFPKLLTPIISKLSADISKKEEKRSLFCKKSMTPKFHEPVRDVKGSGDNHSDDDDDANDYESPNIGSEESSHSDYEQPNDDAAEAEHYELPPSEHSEDLAHKLRSAVHHGDNKYIDTRDKRTSSRGPPTAVCPRPPVASRPPPSPRPVESGQDHSPHSCRGASEKLLPGPPQIFRRNKPGSNSSPIRGPHVAEKPGLPSRRPQADVPDCLTRSKTLAPPPPSSASIGRSNSSVRPPPPPSRIDGIREHTHNDAPKPSTFSLLHKALPLCPTPHTRHGDSLPPGATSVRPLPLNVSSAPDVQGWDDDEFDDEDADYENPNSSGEDSGKGADDDDASNDTDWADNYEPPPTEPSEALTHRLYPALPSGDADYIDNIAKHVSSRGLPPPVSLRPPVSSLPPLSPRLLGESLSGRDHSPHCAGQPLPGKLLPGPPQIFRCNKPGRNSSPIRGHNTEERPLAHSRRPQVDDPDPPARSKPPGSAPCSSASVDRSNSSVGPSPPSRFDGMREQIPSDGEKLPFNHQDFLLTAKRNTFPLHNNLAPRPAPHGRHGDSLPPCTTSVSSLPLNIHPAHADNRSNFAGSDRFRPPPQKSPSKQGMDPRWYVGKVTRGQAEGYLKQVSKDGAYLVRDSSRQHSNQPYTLMVLHQNKVYNIQIRHEDKQFQLGTGLKAQESFPSVCDMIKYHSQCHLLLIDAKKRCLGQQNQCLLSEPAGIYMTGSH